MPLATRATRAAGGLALALALLPALACPPADAAQPRKPGAKADRDRDRLPDRWERRYRISTKRRSARQDPDRDSLSNLKEWRLRLHPRRRDTDRDGLHDGREVRRYKTNPRRADTDGDGIRDGAEVRRGLDPLRPQSPASPLARTPQGPPAPAPALPAAPAPPPAPPAPSAPAPPSAPALPPAPGPADTGEFNISTTWFGNTFGGLGGKFVPHTMQDMAVTADGTVYTASHWEEGGRVVAGFKNGDVFGPKPVVGAPTGGIAVAADTNYIYAARLLGDNRPGVRRYPRAVFDTRSGGDYIGDKDMSLNADIGGWPSLPAAIGVNGGELFVVDTVQAYTGEDHRLSETSVIKVYDAGAMNGQVKRQWAVPRARKLAFDAQGYVWVLQQRSGSSPARVLRYDRNGQLQPQRIENVAEPVAIAFDARNGGRLLVADNGPDQDIKIYRNLTDSPVLDSTFGTKGGYLAGPRRGEVGPRRFDGPRGVGVDAQGNIYVASAGTAGISDRTWSVYELGRHLTLESYRPDGSRSWDVHGLEFTDKGGVDPGSESDIYTRDEHIVMDYSRPVGQQWVYKGRTLDPFAYPDDPRITRSGTKAGADTTWTRRFGGRRFLFMTHQNGGYLSVFRLGSDEIAVPVGFFAPGTASEHIWGDRNGNGRDDGAAERSTRAAGAPASTGWWPDERGDIWQATRDKGIRRFRLQGLDSHGNPIYSYGAMDTYPMPAPFTDLRRMEYDPASDTLYLTGYKSDTFENTSYGAWKAAGRHVARYDNWLAGNRSARWVTDLLPYSTLTTRDGLNKAVSISVAGDYVFVGWLANLPHTNEPFIKVYRAGDGSYRGTIDKRPEVGQKAGWLDAFHSIEAFKRSNGEYMIISEENGWSKNLIYRFCPRARCD